MGGMGTDKERFSALIEKASETRRLLMGALVLSKEVFREELGKKPGGEEVERAVDSAEEVFIDTTLADELDVIEDILDVILKRAEALFALMDYVLKERGKGG